MVMVASVLFGDLLIFVVFLVDEKVILEGLQLGLKNSVFILCAADFFVLAIDLTVEFENLLKKIVDLFVLEQSELLMRLFGIDLTTTYTTSSLTFILLLGFVIEWVTEQIVQTAIAIKKGGLTFLLLEFDSFGEESFEDLKFAVFDVQLSLEFLIFAMEESPFPG